MGAGCYPSSMTSCHPNRRSTLLVTLVSLLAACDGCPRDDGRVDVEPIDVQLGAMYFCPHWPIHKLANSCNQRADAPCAYADLGLPHIKFEDVRWDNVEKSAPVGGAHSYDWSVLDDAVLRWEQVGATHLQFHITPASSWGGQDSRAIAEDQFGLSCDEIKGNCEDMPTNPSAEHMDDWSAWVTALCERYDGDGVDDLEGLRYAHLDFELLNEGQNWAFYMGSSEDFEELLVATRQALNACSDDARIIHYGLTFNGLVHGGVSDELYWERVEQMADGFEPLLLGPGFHHAHNMMLGSPDPDATADAAATIGMCEHFEIVDMHCNMSIEHMIEEYSYLRDVLDSYDCEHVDIICGDSTSAPSLYSPSELEWWDSSYGGTDTTGEAIHAALGEPFSTYGLLCNPSGVTTDLTYDEAKAWFGDQHAAFLVKKSVTALGLGMTGFMAGLLEDWAPANGCYWMYHGLTRSEVEGFGLFPVDYGDPKTAYNSYRLLAESLDGYTATSREVVDEVTVVTFTSDQPDALPKYVVWYLDDHMAMPGEEQLTREFEIEVGGDGVIETSLVGGSMIIANGTSTYVGLASQFPVLVEGFDD
jgi:hypothetical protein